MRKLETVSQKLEAPLQSASGILLALIVVLIFVEVVSRYIFAHSYGFMELFSTWSQVWLTCLLVGVIARKRGHISIDILPRRLPERYKPVLFLVFDTVILGYAIFLVWSGIISIIALNVGGLFAPTEINIPLWVANLCVPLGAIFLAFFAVHGMAADIVSLGKHRGGKE